MAAVAVAQQQLRAGLTGYGTGTGGCHPRYHMRHCRQLRTALAKLAIIAWLTALGCTHYSALAETELRGVSGPRREAERDGLRETDTQRDAQAVAVDPRDVVRSGLPVSANASQ